MNPTRSTDIKGRKKYTKFGKSLHPLKTDSKPNRNPTACDDLTFEKGNPEVIDEPVFEHDDKPFEIGEPD
jgi:hypothetical protein